MTQYLKNLCFTESPSSILEQKIFFEKAFVEVGYKNQEGINRFNLDIVSLSWFFDFLENDENSIYLQHALVLNKFNEQFINEFVKQKIELCNLEEDEEKSFFCLSNYFKYEAEEWLYTNNVNLKYIHKAAEWDYYIDFSEINTMENWSDFNRSIYLNLKEKSSSKKYSFKLNIISPIYIQNKLKETNVFYIKNAIAIKFFDQKIIENQIDKILKNFDYKKNEYLINCLSYYFEKN